MASLGYTKVCNIEDFRDSDIHRLIREIFSLEAESGGPNFPTGKEYRQHWEIAMLVRALRDFNVLRPEAEVLGVGAGTHQLLFYLSDRVKRVIAADLYLSVHKTSDFAPAAMLVEPQRYSHHAFDHTRLDVRHMDARHLNLPENSVDGIFSCGAIHKYEDWTSVAASAYEMGRVLKPGGILALSTEFLISGPHDAQGWEGILLFTPKTIQQYIVEASGLDYVDGVDFSISCDTLATPRDISSFLAEIDKGAATLPHLVIVHQGQAFCSVHITLRKKPSYPKSDNRWAKPPEELQRRIQADAIDLGDLLTKCQGSQWTSRISDKPFSVKAENRSRNTPSSRQLVSEAVFAQWDSVRERSALSFPETGTSLQRTVGFLKRTAKRIRDLGLARDHDRVMFRALLDYCSELEQRLGHLESRSNEHP